MKLAIEDNTVSSENQVEETSCVVPYPVPNPALKIAVVGNSITLHRPKHDIGWYGDWGMAASAPEKDFFHLLMHDVREKYPATDFVVIQAADWERNFWADEKDWPHALKVLDSYDPDIIVFRIAENCSKELCAVHDYSASFMALCDHFSDGGRRRLLITNSFWYSPWTEEGINRAAEKYCGTPVPLSDLGNLPEMKALGLFEHAGVAAHPGDVGMRAIADRILERLLPEIEAFFAAKETPQK